MSRVFVAEEVALKRRVVIKVLPSDLSGAVSIERFKREILFAAQLQHPHIVPLLSVGEVDGTAYYTMPFVDGDSLRSRLARGNVPLRQSISILRDVARALDYAHEKGVAHRDIKPDNILLAGTSAVITDFGVAKALTDASVSGDMTTAGVALGTPAYMAPEQVAADPRTDLRADIYSFGATAYEMLTGNPPFQASSIRALMAAHVLETPKPVADIRRDLPPALANLVMRCLAKEPGDRPQRAREIVNTLESIPVSESDVRASASSIRFNRTQAIVAAGVIGVLVLFGVTALWWTRTTTGSVGDTINSIAVIPFINASGDSTFNYLEDGITDQVRDALGVIPGITVKARSSSRQLMHAAARDIGRKLGVAAVLQGTVSRSSARLHVTAELVRTIDETALWSSTFDGHPEELTGIQDRITRAVTARLRTNVVDTDDAAARRAARGTNDVGAYDLYLQGRYAYDRLDFLQAAAKFRASVERDSSFARGHGYLAMTYANSPTIGIGSIDSMNVLATASAAKALSLDAGNAEAYVAQGFVLLSEMRFADGLIPLEKAVRIDATNPDVVSNYGLSLGQVGRVGEGLRFAEQGRILDPLSSNANGIYSGVLEWARRYDDAIAAARIAMDIDRSNVLVHQALGYYFAFSGRADSAVKEFETAFKLDSTLYNGRANLIFGYAAAGRWKDAERQRALFEFESAGNSPNYRAAIVYLAFGEYDRAASALERAVSNREALVGLASIACDPLFDPLKSNSRYVRVTARIGVRPCPAKGVWPITPTKR